MRGLNPHFLQDLQTGRLASLLRRVQSDETLDLQLRRNSLNVYYRGTSLLTVTEESPGVYTFKFDVNYFHFEEPPRPCIDRVTKVASEQDCTGWLTHVPELKDAMDRWRTLKKSAWEREAQQLLVRDNNRGEVARSTDYFICDVEYGQTDEFRIDAIAVKWPSTPLERKSAEGLRLALVEVKFGGGALDGPSGLVAHVQDADALAANPERLEQLKREMVELFNQKHTLGLIDCGKQLSSFSDEKPQLLLVLANHDPEKSVLERELRALSPRHVEVRIASANLFGYGLYQERMLTLDTFLQNSRR